MLQSQIGTSSRIWIVAGITSDLRGLPRCLPKELLGPPAARSGPRGSLSCQPHDHVRVIDVSAEFAAASRETPGRNELAGTRERGISDVPSLPRSASGLSRPAPPLAQAPEACQCVWDIPRGGMLSLSP